MCVHVYTHIYIYMHIYTYICVYIYTHTASMLSKSDRIVQTFRKNLLLPSSRNLCDTLFNDAIAS